MVRIVKAADVADRVGSVARITSRLKRSTCPGGAPHVAGWCWCAEGLPEVHELDIVGYGGSPVAYPPSYLEPYHEPGDFQSLAELLRSLKGVPAKEKA